MKRHISFDAASLLCAAALASANASALNIDFESLADGAAVTNQFAGVGFSNATTLKAGFSLNEVEFPPHSGSVVVFDDGDPMTLLFSRPVTQVGAFFTYVAPLTLTAWDAFDLALGSVLSLFSTNAALSGDSGSVPNEFLELAFASGIAKLTVSGDADGASFVLDDLSFTPAALPAPEPATAALTAIALAGLLARRRFAGEVPSVFRLPKGGVHATCFS